MKNSIIAKVKKNTYQMVMALAVTMFFLGAAATVSVHQNYKAEVMQREEEELFSMAGQIDRNLNYIMTRCYEELNYLSSREEFVVAEDKFRTLGRGADLWLMLRDNPLVKNNVVRAIVVVDNKKVIMASHEDMNQQLYFYHNIGSDVIMPATDEHGNYYLAIFFNSPHGHYRYAALIDMRALYLEITGEQEEHRDRIYLFSSEFCMLMQKENNYVKLTPIAINSGRQYDELSGSIRVMQKYQGSHTIGAEDYVQKDASGNMSRNRIVVLPTRNNINNIFAVGISRNMDSISRSYVRMTWMLVVSLGLIFTGVFLLILSIISLRKKEQEKDSELEDLRLKKEYAEETLKMTKELEHNQRLEMIGTMTAGLAHEFNNMLTPVMSYSMLTLEGLPEDSELFDYVEEIYNSSRKAKGLLSQISAMSRKKQETVVREISPDLVIRNVIKVMKASQPGNVEVALELNCPEPCVRINETQFAQVIMNLTLNAYQAMAETGGNVMISTEEYEEKWIRILVKDNGPGIPEEIIDKIFDPFYTTKEIGKGTGLGLAICSQIIYGHGGDLSVNSELGKGSTFVILLQKIHANLNEY